jgi:hypothetical protein
MAAKTHFEQLIDAEKRKMADSAMKLANGDSHGLTELKGICRGLDKAVELMREAGRKDMALTGDHD